MACVLLVDDDQRLRNLLHTFLTESGFNVYEAAHAAQARDILQTHAIDIMVLDIMMEGEDGLALTQSLRSHTTYAFPIMLLTARDTVNDCVVGLDSGADDYMTKPFEPAEFLARLRALLRHTHRVHDQHTSIAHILSLGTCRFDTHHRRLKKGDEDIILTSNEHALLCMLAQAPGTPFDRRTLAQGVGHHISERTVDVQIARLRRKIEDDPHNPRYIQTVRHIGYGLYPDTRREQNGFIKAVVNE